MVIVKKMENMRCSFVRTCWLDNGKGKYGKCQTFIC